jgi:hypothetical protein
LLKNTVCSGNFFKLDYIKTCLSLICSLKFSKEIVILEFMFIVYLIKVVVQPGLGKEGERADNKNHGQRRVAQLFPNKKQIFWLILIRICFVYFAIYTVY